MLPRCGVTTLITSVLGFGFWIAAARLFPIDSVGIASAAISAMMLLAQFGLLGMGTLLIGELAGGEFTAGLVSAATLLAGGVSFGLGARFRRPPGGGLDQARPARSWCGRTVAVRVGYRDHRRHLGHGPGLHRAQSGRASACPQRNLLPGQVRPTPGGRAARQRSLVRGDVRLVDRRQRVQPHHFLVPRPPQWHPAGPGACISTSVRRAQGGIQSPLAQPG